MNPITAWARWSPGGDFQGKWTHNHIQDGHVKGDRPVGHPDWKGGRWRYRHLYWSKEDNQLHFIAHCADRNPVPEGNASFQISNGIYDNDPDGKSRVGTIHWLEIRKGDVLIERHLYGLLEVLNGTFDPEVVKRSVSQRPPNVPVE